MSMQQGGALRPQSPAVPSDLPAMPRPVLSLHDYGRLETALFDELDLLSPMQPRIRTKLAEARVIPGEEIPESVVTLGSIVKYRIDGDRIERRILQPDRTPAPNGQYVSVFTPVGLALLGRVPGDIVGAELFDGAMLKIVIIAVDFQPEADSRRRERTPHPGDNGPEAA